MVQILIGKKQKLVKSKYYSPYDSFFFVKSKYYYNVFIERDPLHNINQEMVLLIKDRPQILPMDHPRWHLITTPI